ncbi:MAG: AraC family transcriptional regulator [Kofleriaceae bacterium]|nr:AraC family transcriptional regulator [Kofleriaceae bacterium]
MVAHATRWSARAMLTSCVLSDADQVEGARFTVAASSVRGFLAYAAARKISTDGVLALAGLAPTDLEGPEARITQAANNTVVAELARRSGDPDFGLHVAERLDLDAFDVVGHLAARSATLGQAFERVCAFSRILHDAGRVDLEHRASSVVLYPGCRGLTHMYPRHVAEFATLGALVLARRVTGVPIVPRAVTFKHAAPARTAEHHRLLGVSPTFDEPETAISFEPAVLGLRIEGSQPGLASHLDAYARDVMSRLPDDNGIVATVERVVTTQLARGVPEIEAIALQIAVSARTLQRRLADEGTTFADVVDRARRQLAERYLADDRLSLAEIGFLVGFSDPSNFHRAFKRWTGVTPKAFRDARSAPTPR